MFGKLLKCAGVVAVSTAALGVTALPASAATPSPIAQRYSADHAVAQLLGAPTGPEFSEAGGSERDYKWGSLYYSTATGVHEVHGANWWRYKGLGGPTKFGFPTTDEYNVSESVHGPIQTFGAANKYTGGEIFWNAETNKTNYMGLAASKVWDDMPFPFYGTPTGDEVNHGSYKQVSFNIGSEIYVSSKGAFGVTQGDANVFQSWIAPEYKTTGGATGYLGLPTSAAAYSSVSDNAQWTQYFDSGVVINHAGVAHAFHGAIYWAYSHDADKTRLGWPTADEANATGGRVSTFSNGSISWNASTNTTTITYNS